MLAWIHTGCIEAVKVSVPVLGGDLARGATSSPVIGERSSKQGLSRSLHMFSLFCRLTDWTWDTPGCKGNMRPGLPPASLACLLGEALHEQTLEFPWVGSAPGLFHYLPHKETLELCLPCRFEGRVWIKVPRPLTEVHDVGSGSNPPGQICDEPGLSSLSCCTTSQHCTTRTLTDSPPKPPTLLVLLELL